MPLIILDKHQRTAEAIISGFEFKTLAFNGIRRYGILFRQPPLVPYAGNVISTGAASLSSTASCLIAGSGGVITRSAIVPIANPICD
jgi:hypothetical protein